jgi:hypothetical protein
MSQVHHINHQIEDAISSLAIAKQLEVEAKLLKQKASDILMPFMSSASLKTIESKTSRGSVVYVAPTISKKFSKDKAKAELLMRGVDADVIAESFEASTEESNRAGYVSFKPDKQK